MSNIFYTSDMHFGHANIIKFCNRPFSNVDEMNEKIIYNWNNIITPDDTVIVLGDVALGPIDHSLKCVGRLMGHKFLVPGNHDRCWLHAKKFSNEWVHRYIDAGFESVIHYPGLMPFWSHWAQISHFPFIGDSQETDRYQKYRPKPKDAGEFVVHGHVHTAWKVKDRQINVGVDVWDFKPVHSDKIAKIMDDIRGKRIRNEAI